MKNFILLLVLFPIIVSAQVTENFDDGDFTNNPAWVGDAGSWQVSGGQLNSNNITANSTYYLSTVSTLATGALWEIWVNFKQATSSANYMDIYLTSDIQDLNGAGNGYFVRIGGTDDEISLYKKTAGTATEIIDGADDRSEINSSDNYYKIKVLRTSANLWTLLDDNTGAGTNFFVEGSITDAAFTSSDYFGILIKQSTSSFFNKHFFDSIYVGVDVVPPSISSINVINQTQIDVSFNEPVDQSSAETISNYSVDNTIGNPNSAIRDLTNLSLVHLVFTNSFQSGVTNTLSVLNVKDLSSNPISTASTGQFTYYIVDTAALSDIILNEILYSPREDGAEFIEIYNRSQKVIDLSSLRICEVDLSDNSLGTPIMISTTKHLFLPGEYIVLSDDPDAVKSNYSTPNPDGFIKVTGFPSLNNDGDNIAIINIDSLRIDQFNYSPDYQFPLLNDDTGISLERISFNRPTQDSTNWHSAAETVGFATPAYENSQHAEVIDDGSEVSVEPEIFSPDNDGNNDVVNINYHFGEPGYTANLKIFDSKGREIIHLIKNELLGTTGTFTWNGITKENEKAKIGIYVAYLEIFNEKGTVKKFKKPVVLASKL